MSQIEINFKTCPDKLEIIGKSKIEYFVKLNGKLFELKDLYDCLSSVKDDNVIVESWLGEELIKIGVLDYLGSNRWGSGASMGLNFDKFYEMVKELYYAKVED